MIYEVKIITYLQDVINGIVLEPNDFYNGNRLVEKDIHYNYIVAVPKEDYNRVKMWFKNDTDLIDPVIRSNYQLQYPDHAIVSISHYFFMNKPDPLNILIHNYDRDL